MSAENAFDGSAFVRLEYWDPAAQEWVHGHAGIRLLHPRRYVERLAANGKVGRVTDLDTGEIFQLAEPPTAPVPCAFCGERHGEPRDGSCLI